MGVQHCCGVGANGNRWGAQRNNGLSWCAHHVSNKFHCSRESYRWCVETTTWRVHERSRVRGEEISNWKQWIQWGSTSNYSIDWWRVDEKATWLIQCKSGVGVIIGLHPNKLLHIGVCNNECTGYHRRFKEHTCFKTGMTAHQQWRQTEGFKRAEKDHGVNLSGIVTAVFFQR